MFFLAWAAHDKFDVFPACSDTSDARNYFGHPFLNCPSLQIFLSSPLPSASSFYQTPGDVLGKKEEISSAIEGQ